ncbi:hypothetical protein DV737_g402, partial [Chaetothyriales sp. CBS 132003]
MLAPQTAAVLARRLAGPSSPSTTATATALRAAQYGRTAAYRRLRPTATSAASLLLRHRQAAAGPPPSLVRALHSSARRSQQPKAAEDIGDRPREGEDSKAGEAKSGGQKAGGQTDGGRDDGKQTDGDKTGGDKTDGDKQQPPPPPPPPHGDKTPWQVFTDTLRSEFKASQEWQDSTKQLAGEVKAFNESEAVRRAREASEAASSGVGKVVRGTGRAIGQGASWTWNTPAVQGARASVNAVGRGIEKATRPVRETQAFKEISDAIDDGSSSRYGGWAEKEERRARRARNDLRSARRPVEKAEEDPNAGTNITLHKDAAWRESWNSFKDNSRVMQSLFNMRSTYEESENPLISTARSVTDRIAGFFVENETAKTIKKFREMDPNFQVEPFLRDMREYILPEVLDAYVKGDVETLKLWLSAAQFQVYHALVEQYTKAGLRTDGKVLDIRGVDILNARIIDPGEIPVFVITCRTQEVHVYRNVKTGQLAAGQEDKVQQVTYAIGVTRLPEEVNNAETRGWRMIELQKAARDYY